MRCQFPFGLLAAAAIVTSGIGIGVYSAYSRPNLSTWSDQDLMSDSVLISLEHENDAYPLQLLHTERQRYVSAEFTRRSQIRMGRLLNPEWDGPSPCARRVITLAPTKGTTN